MVVNTLQGNTNFMDAITKTINSDIINKYNVSFETVIIYSNINILTGDI